METITIIMRFIITFVLALVFGFERQRSHKPVGVGTFTFVALGACGLAMTAIILYPDNPLPLLGAIVTGIGFLGAGALIKTSDKIFGATTAASIWVFAIFGVMIGTGKYLIGIILYALLWAAILCDKYLAKRGMGSYRRKIVVYANKIIPTKEIEKILLIGLKRHELVSVEINKKDEKCSFTYFVEGSREQMNSSLKQLFEKEWFDSIKAE